MAKFQKLLLAALMLGMNACGGGGTNNIEVEVTQSSLPLIPAATYSCYARKTAAEPDITASYFKIPTVTFTRKDSAKDFVVALMRITIQVPLTGGTIKCELGGDNLLSLSSIWWNPSATSPGYSEAKVAAGTDSFVTDCPWYCGGVAAETSFSATGVLEVFGLERDPATAEETPVKISTQISVQSF